ncbi:hypothetical protein [Rhizobium sp. G21]|uniref:hypothetical protein n=1 Tax=Rhizobium sp. G21 TaxID=2758439 RepID=UPI0015FECB59|nr:hypothetical protein [Rhizobium sp. G21]MBB1248239.1 hypothetical protein [Rhizobium sp. G21]
MTVEQSRIGHSREFFTLRRGMRAIARDDSANSAAGVHRVRAAFDIELGEMRSARMIFHRDLQTNRKKRGAEADDRKAAYHDRIHLRLHPIPVFDGENSNQM